MKLPALALLAALVVTGCGGSATPDTAAAEPTATSAAPSPKPKKTKNPLASSANRTACEKSRRDVSKQADVFDGVGKGTALPADAAKAARKLQGDLGDAASFAEGPIRAELAGLADTYGRMRVTLTTGDLEGLSAAVAAQNKGLTELDRLCASIGK